ncbi:MAG: hypothetical protein ACYCSR_12120 [Thiomonas sp.]
MRQQWRPEHNAAVLKLLVLGRLGTHEDNLIERKSDSPFALALRQTITTFANSALDSCAILSASRTIFECIMN